MQLKDRIAFTLPQEQLTIPELGGDGVVLVRGIGFGQKLELIGVPPLRQSLELLAICVLDEDGLALNSADGWDAFAVLHEDQFGELIAAAKRVSGLDAGEVKKA